ncbi:MAG: protein DpdH [Gammaproteobacteria bacterium]
MSTAPRHPLPGLTSYWPSVEEVRQCIGTEAEALPDAVLLAVHRRVDLLKRPFGGIDPGTRCNEEALLEFVLGELKPEGYLLAPITGPSGAGKSHLVRWLEIRLRNHPQAARFNLIRVPKSASLRTVVEAVLQPVAHLPEYAEMLQGLKAATSALAPGEAAALFGTMLQLGLSEKARQWQQDHGAPIEGFRSTVLAAHAQQLASFLQDPVVAPYFREHVYPRLLARAMRGRDEASLDADRPPSFEIADLTLPPDVDSQIVDAAQATRVYYLSRLSRPDGRPAALVALNAVVDGAVARVFKLGQLSHGKTLQDIMNEIRETLHAAGRELVLLVEDFYALTGIQDQLLGLCIQGVNDGPRPMCPMRTVMAMTDATLDGRDTIKTRSEFEWNLVTEDPRDEYVIDALVELAGGYLNAARVGRQRLVDSYDPVAGTVGTQFTPEVDDPESSDLRQAFGTTANGIPLFPLSLGAIHFLARKHLVDGGRLRFDPRRALQRIVRDVLLARGSFERGDFPGGFPIQDPLSVELTGVLSGVPEALKERYRRAIVCWGNDPRTSAELQQLPAGVLEAFGLPPLPVSIGTGVGTGTGTSTGAGTGTGPGPGARAGTDIGNDTGTGTGATQPDPAAAINDRWRQRMDEWVRGQRLVHADAQKLRVLVRDHLVHYVDWNALSLYAKDFDAQSFALPNAPGNERLNRPDRPVIQVKGPVGLTDAVEPELARELLALLRFEHVKSWDYPDADEDAICAAAFLDRMAGEVEHAALQAAELRLVPLAHGALWSGVVRAGLPAFPASLMDRMGAALQAGDAVPLAAGAPLWDELRQECWNQREILRRLLLRYVRVVQGEAENPYGIDAARFARALDKAPLDAAGISTRLDQDGDVLPAIRALLAQLTAPRLKPVMQEAVKIVENWTRVVLAETDLEGEPDEPTELSRAAIALMEDALKSGLWPAPPPGRPAHPPTRPAPPDHAAMSQTAQRFADLRWAELVARCRALVALDRGAEPVQAVSMLAGLPWSELQASRKFIEDYSSLLEALDRSVTAEEAVLGTSDAGQAIGAVSGQLASLEAAVTKLAMG